MRLFVTVGTQFPFDRLVRTVDDWVGRTAGVEAFAQVGPGSYTPRHMGWATFVNAVECRRYVEEASAVLAHAGMGSIITALELGKPIIVMPRRAGLGEHRNDHQLATARSLLAQGKVTVAMDEPHLVEKLAQLEQLSSPRTISKYASPRLISALREFIQTGAHAASGADVAVGSGMDMPSPARRQPSRQPNDAGVLVNG